MVKDTRLWIGTETGRGETSWRQFESARGYLFSFAQLGKTRPDCAQLGTIRPRSYDEVDCLRKADEAGRVEPDELAVEIEERALRALGLDEVAAGGGDELEP